MHLVTAGILAGSLVATAASAAAPGGWVPQASPIAPSPPVYVAPPVSRQSPKPSKARPPKPAENPSNWLTVEDYPPASMRDGEQGTTTFRLTIDKTGRPIACDITGSSGYARLDQATCWHMMRRSKFTIPLNEKGKPTTGTWASRIRWALPAPQELVPPKPM